MSKPEGVKMKKGKKNCKYCYGKGYSSQLVKEIGGADFDYLNNRLFYYWRYGGTRYRTS